MNGLTVLFKKLYLNWIKVGTKKELTSEKDSGLNVSGEAAGETRIPDLLPESRDRDHHHHHSNK